MQAIIRPSGISGTVAAPASKSMMQRACAAALLHGGTTLIRNYGQSEDDQAALGIIRQLGATATFEEGKVLRIVSSGTLQVKEGTVLDCGESGLSLRMFSPIAALSAVPVSITGRGSLLQRPAAFIEELLPRLGVTVRSVQGRLPLELQGPLNPAEIHVDGALTSQFLTGLLLAFAAQNASCTLHVRDLKSRPYIDLTLQVMEAFGMKLPRNDRYERFCFEPGRPAPAAETIRFAVEGDWSNAAFLLVAGAVAGDVTVTGLDVFSQQADKKILEALQDCGCRLSIQAEQIEVAHRPLKAFHFNATDCPDLFPPLVALAACCRGISVIEGVHRLRHKESDRALALQQEAGRLGIGIKIQEDLMMIEGGGKIKGGRVDSHNDHRIAMAFSIAALQADGPVTVARSEAVHKSFPGFYGQLQELCGADAVQTLL